MSKLTIGMSVYDDYEGAYFTLQALRLYHSDVMKNVEFVVLNNNPNNNQSDLLRDLVYKIREPSYYIEFKDYSSTALRSRIFDIANTEYVLVIDSHVLIEGGALKKLINFYDSGKDRGNLLQGPLIYDGLDHYSTHFELKWSSYMWGVWETDKRGSKSTNKPFEIPAQGLGLFSCRKDSWLGFNKDFRGFGGEEGYIHEKYRQAGKKTLCLPFLRWLHRFHRPNGVPYRNDLLDRYKNYLIGFNELGLDTTELIEHFSKSITPEHNERIKSELNIA